MKDDERILREPPMISPLADGAKRPLWSVMIPVYNCAAFLPSTLRTVLIQDPGEATMQIEVVDDGSTDADVEKIVREIGKGRVKYFRQPRNVGSLRNFKTCLERANGFLVHLLHGDDRVRHGFYKRMQDLFSRHPEIGAAFCRYAYIDERGNFMYSQAAEMEKEGVLEDWFEKLCERQRIQYAAMVVRRSVYENLGGFYGAEYGEDWEMWVRIAARYRIGYIPEILAEYRKHASSISGRSFITGKNMDELRWVMDRIGKLVPEDKREAIGQESRRFYAHYALRTANQLWKELRHKPGALAQVKAAWSMQKDPFLCYKILKLFTRMTLNL
jgi:glycosyltransferase involved in cell wall biosynthesis